MTAIKGNAFNITNVPSSSLGTISDSDLITFTISNGNHTKDKQYTMTYAAFKLLILATDSIAEKTVDAGVTIDSTLLRNGVVFVKPSGPVAINITATATAAQIASGLITSTSAAAVALTTPTAAALVALLGLSAGASFDFVVDNSGGANTVTVTLDASITAETAVLTGAATLTVAAAKVGIFKLYFLSTTAAVITRVM